MPLTSSDIKHALEILLPLCRSCGTKPSELASYLAQQLLPVPDAEEIKITLDNDEEIRFIAQTHGGRTILTSIDSLSTHIERRKDLELLPEILHKLREKNIQFTAIQFPHAFMVKNRINGAKLRCHYNQIIIYKDNSGAVNATIIDSTSNPIGLCNAFAGLGWFGSYSLLSGKEMVQSKLIRLLMKAEVVHLLQKLCDSPNLKNVCVTNPLLTGKQPSLSDKRCGLYTFALMASMIDYVTSAAEITTRGIAKQARAAHQILNEPAMLELSQQTSAYQHSLSMI